MTIQCYHPHFDGSIRNSVGPGYFRDRAACYSRKAGFCNLCVAAGVLPGGGQAEIAARRFRPSPATNLHRTCHPSESSPAQSESKSDMRAIQVKQTGGPEV